MPLKLTQRKLIVVEGLSDKAFLEAFLPQRGLDHFDVFAPWEMGNRLEGKDAIPNLLDAIQTQRTFWSLPVEKVVVLVDSDEDPAAAFAQTQAALRKIAPALDNAKQALDWPIPAAPDTPASTAGMPDVVIRLMPDSQHSGAFETLCWEAGISANPNHAACIQAFADCVDTSAWLPQKQSKFLLRALVSASAPKNPDLPTTKLWEKMPNLVPVNSTVFDSLAAFLAAI